jgi:RNA polymerase sigma-70 factor (ECF subfamily)
MAEVSGDACVQDAALHRAVIDGSASAFGDLFDAYAGELFSFCVRRCGDRSAAEDLVSVVFLEAWRCHRRAVLVEGSLRPWLYGIARNVVRNATRAARRHRAALDRYHAANPELAVADHADEVVRAVDAPAVSATVTAALARLSGRHRDVVELCLVTGLSTGAVAMVLGVSETAVKSRLARARRELQRLLRTSEPSTPPAWSGHEQGERPTGASAGKGQPSWTGS